MSRWKTCDNKLAINTERLLLRDLSVRDLRAVHEYSSNPEVVHYMDWGPNTEEDDRSFIRLAAVSQHEKPRMHYSLGITLKDTNKLIGGCGIHESNPDNREGWIGYCLNREYWRKGYATETANALIAFGFSRLRLHRIFVTCDPANTASAHVLEKAGMHCGGHLRQHKWAKRRWRDSLLYAILDQEWKQLNASQK